MGEEAGVEAGTEEVEAAGEEPAEVAEGVEPNNEAGLASATVVLEEGAEKTGALASELAVVVDVETAVGVGVPVESAAGADNSVVEAGAEVGAGVGEGTEKRGAADCDSAAGFVVGVPGAEARTVEAAKKGARDSAEGFAVEELAAETAEAEKRGAADGAEAGGVEGGGGGGDWIKLRK